MRRAALAFILSMAVSAPAMATVITTNILGPDAASCASGSADTAVLLSVDGFRNREGTLRIEMWPGNDRDFLRSHHELVAEGLPYARVTVEPPAAGPALVCVRLPQPGIYALGVFHSPAGVRKFNFRRDGATFTRNPKIGIRKPRASEVAVEYGPGPNREKVTLNYLRGLSFRPIEGETHTSAGHR